MRHRRSSGSRSRFSRQPVVVDHTRRETRDPGHDRVFAGVRRDRPGSRDARHARAIASTSPVFEPAASQLPGIRVQPSPLTVAAVGFHSRSPRPSPRPAAPPGRSYQDPPHRHPHKHHTRRRVNNPDTGPVRCPAPNESLAGHGDSGATVHDPPPGSTTTPGSTPTSLNA